MNTAKRVYESDDAGVVHVDVPVGEPGRRVEVVVTWQDVEGPAAVDPGEDWSDLFGILKDTPLERGPQGAYEKRDPLE